MSDALRRILSRPGDEAMLDRLSGMSATELNTLLLEVYRRQCGRETAADLLKRYDGNRFVHPSGLDPIGHKRIEIEVLQTAKAHGYEAVQLSPVAPLGSCSIVATVDQNKVLSALRGTEAVADATNLLALHICREKKSRKSAPGQRHRFCATHRHIRAQKFDRPGLLPHFNLFCMVTSGRDEGSYTFEKQAFIEHVGVYRDLFRTLPDTGIELRLSRRDGYSDGEGLVQRLEEAVAGRFPEIGLRPGAYNADNRYYQGMQFSIFVQAGGQDINIGDGGFVDWPQKLLSDKKERMMISAVGLERIAQLAADLSPGGR